MTAIVRFAARPLITAQTGPKAVGSVIFLHGSGMDHDHHFNTHLPDTQLVTGIGL